MSRQPESTICKWKYVYCLIREERYIRHRIFLVIEGDNPFGSGSMLLDVNSKQFWDCQVRLAWNRSQVNRSKQSFARESLNKHQTLICQDLNQVGYSTWRLNLPPKKEEGKGGREPNLALNLKLNFRVLIRPYWPGQANSLIKGIELDLCHKNQNVRGRKGLKNRGSLILCTVRNMC